MQRRRNSKNRPSRTDSPSEEDQVMTCIDTVVVGAGHAGLAVSWFLTHAGREHVLLDRGRVAERWRSERWDSLHLLTPNWMTRLPGCSYAGPDPDGYQSAPP